MALGKRGESFTTSNIRLASYHVTYHGCAGAAPGTGATGGHDLVQGRHAVRHETAQGVIGDSEAGTDNHRRIDDSLAFVTPAAPVRDRGVERERQFEDCPPNSNQPATTR